MVSTWDPYYETPFFVRCIVVVQIALFLGGFLVGDEALPDCPYETITHMRIFRPFTAPFMADSVINLLFTGMTMTQAIEQQTLLFDAFGCIHAFTSPESYCNDCCRSEVTWRARWERPTLRC